MVGGMHFKVGHVHFTKAARDLTTPILVFESELPVLRATMTHLSLAEGLKWFGMRGKQGALREMKQLHEMHSSSPET